MRPKHLAGLVCAAVMLPALAGCKLEQTGEPSADAPAAFAKRAPGAASQPPLYLLAGNRDPKSRYSVTAAVAPFFVNGPSQSQGADFCLHKGDAVTMLERDFGYSRVRTGNGREGYVSTDQLKPEVPQVAENPAALPPPAAFPASQLPEPLQVPTMDQMVSPAEPPLPTGGASPTPAAPPGSR